MRRFAASSSRLGAKSFAVCAAATGTLSLEIAGTAADQFDALSVEGDAVLDGLLDLSLLDGFIPQPSESFAILTAAGLSGQFDNVIGGEDRVRRRDVRRAVFVHAA